MGYSMFFGESDLLLQAENIKGGPWDTWQDSYLDLLTNFRFSFLPVSEHQPLNCLLGKMIRVNWDLVFTQDSA